MPTAKDIMTKEVITVTRETSLQDLSRIFMENGINGLPVVDEEGAVIGVVTQGDLIEQKKQLHIPTVIALFDWVVPLESEKKFEADVKKMTASTVADIFHPHPVTVDVNADLTEIATLMAEEDVHTLPVLDGGRLVGIIGKLDLIRGFA
ncbi:MAG: CBS domain-containing protein [Nitrospinaceae bacterium]|jgi:CBS domain-containing protein|nr:MAG: CBS domain-containing protein [Nitrospinaceae bacterium]